MITETKLPYLLKLLDDQEPVTQAALKSEFANSSGDLSHELTALGSEIDLSPKDKAKLSNLLLPARRDTLISEWQIPAGGQAAMAEDWDSFEYHLRLISDYLHDGISLRPTLSDTLDILTENYTKEHHNAISDVNTLREWLFTNERFKGNKDQYYHPNNSDLCWVVDAGLGNPISLTTLFMLVARRLDFDVTGCNYPGHFLARIFHNDEIQLVDCFHKGKLIPVKKILSEHKEISHQAKTAIMHPSTLGGILTRFLRNIEHSLKQSDVSEQNNLDLQLFQKLIKSLER